MMPGKRVAPPPMVKSGHTAPAGKAAGSNVGNETKAAVKDAQMGQPTNGLKGAMDHLRSEHPMRADDLPSAKGGVGKGSDMKGY